MLLRTYPSLIRILRNIFNMRKNSNNRYVNKIENENHPNRSRAWGRVRIKGSYCIHHWLGSVILWFYRIILCSQAQCLHENDWSKMNLVSRQPCQSALFCTQNYTLSLPLRDRKSFKRFPETSKRSLGHSLQNIGWDAFKVPLNYNIE